VGVLPGHCGLIATHPMGMWGDQAVFWFLATRQRREVFTASPASTTDSFDLLFALVGAGLVIARRRKVNN